MKNSRKIKKIRKFLNRSLRGDKDSAREIVEEWVAEGIDPKQLDAEEEAQLLAALPNVSESLKSAIHHRLAVLRQGAV